MKRYLMLLLAILTCIVTLATPAFAGGLIDPSSYYIGVGTYDSASNGYHLLPLDPSGNGYVAHVGDIVAAGVFCRSFPTNYDWSDSLVTGPESVVDSSSGWKMGFTPIPGTRGVRLDTIGIALYHTSVFVANPFDWRSCPENIGLSTSLRVEPAIVPAQVKVATYGPVQVSTGCLVEFCITNTGKTRIDGTDIWYTGGNSGIVWRYSTSGYYGPFTNVSQNLPFGTKYKIQQIWVKYAGDTKWRLQTGTIGYGYGWGMGNMEPGMSVGIQLILKPTN